MDIKKINQLILKWYYKNAYIDKPHNNDIIFGEYQDKVVVVDGGCRFFMIPAKKFVFDKSKLTDTDKMFNVEAIIKADSVPAVNTGEMRTHGKGVVVKFRTEDGVIGWFNKDYFKEFDKDLTFKASIWTGKNDYPRLYGLYVYEANALVGFILPVNINEEV